MKEHLYYLLRGLIFLGGVAAFLAACLVPMFINPIFVLILPILFAAWALGQVLD